ncbi:MAG: hypothetical protein PUD04_07120 [Firmicutes bacterium]|nr:hypothetical protein [Bacillota bacterium]
MRRRTKWMAVSLCLLVMTMALMGCGASGNKVTNSASESSESVSKEKEQAGTEVSIEEQVLYDEKDIKITAKGIKDGWMGTELALLIENNSGKGITVQARNANVNGYMVPTTMSADVASGKKANDSLTFETSGLKECGIETIAKVEFSFHIFDTESWDDIVNTDVIKIATSAADSYKQTYDDSGNVLVDKKGIRIIEKGLTEDDSFWGPGIVLYIENNSDRDITVQTADVSVNGFMVDATMSEDVIAGRKAMSAVQFLSTDLEENSIEKITDVELKFNIIDMESFDNIFDSDTLSITYK